MLKGDCSGRSPGYDSHIQKGMTGVHILVVDDDHFSLLAMARPLRQAGYEVVEAMRAEQVMKAAEHGEYKVVIMDIFMPGMGGIQAIQRIRAASPSCKIAAVSAGMGNMPAEDVIRAAVKVGADTGFPKPIQIDDLLAFVRSVGAPEPTEKH
jgi:CheY-like chemotaxis protein